jgi:hypothetical protein
MLSATSIPTLTKPLTSVALTCIPVETSYWKPVLETTAAGGICAIEQVAVMPGLAVNDVNFC